MGEKRTDGFRGPEELCTPFSREKVIELFREVHGDMYDYSDFVYTRALDKGLIRCNYCGFEKYMSYWQHYAKQSDACESCAKELGKYFAIYLSGDKVWDRIKKSPNYKVTDYSLFKYNGHSKKSIFVCTKHNYKYEQLFFNHVDGLNGCSSCAKEKRQQKAFDKWIAECKEKHSNKFIYDNAYMAEKSKHAWIQCKEHGWIKVCRSWHKKYGNCAKCTQQGHKGSYSLYNYTEEESQSPATLYYVKITTSRDEFEKVGITVQKPIMNRFCSFTDCKVVILNSIEDSLRNTIVKEEEILQLLSSNNLRYKVKTLKKLDIAGWTECFPSNSIDISEYFKQ